MLHSETGNKPNTQGPRVESTTHGDWREARRQWREEMRKNRQHFPHGLGFGLTVLLLGVLFLLNQLGVVSGDRWWQSLLIGLGGICIINGVAHLVSPGYRWRSYGLFVCGLVLAAAGTLFIVGLGQWWSLALIFAGLALLLRFFWRR